MKIPLFPPFAKGDETGILNDEFRQETINDITRQGGKERWESTLLS